jgi:hypothetical protein
MAMHTVYSALDEMLDPLIGILTPDVAQRIVDYKLDSKLQTRINRLRIKRTKAS